MQLENPAPRRTRPNMPLAPPSLTRDQRRAFLRDGFVVIRNAVPLDMVATARELILAEMPASERRILAPAKLATHPDVIRLFRQTRLADVMRNEMGPFPEVVSCQIAMTPGHDKLGGTPRPHVDGSWSGPIPTRAERAARLGRCHRVLQPQPTIRGPAVGLDVTVGAFSRSTSPVPPKAGTSVRMLGTVKAGARDRWRSRTTVG